jgi:outer membrane protein OmpA-like peptidoglycan-associated protein
MVAASRETPNRQYWETLLLCPLQPGEHYHISLKVASPGKKSEGPGEGVDLSTTPPNLRDIGLWFTTRFVFVYGDSILQPRSFLSFTDASVKDLKNGWFEIKKEYTPYTGANVLIIGNFARAANADIMEQRDPPNPTIDVLVDDLSIVPAKGTICPGYEKVKDSLYAILWRHSDNIPGTGIPPDIRAHRDDIPRNPLPFSPPDAKNPVNPAPGTVPVNPGSGTPNHLSPADSARRHKNNPVPDPLFGPEPHRTIDTPNRAVSPPPATDTIIIHNIQFDFDKYLVQNPDTLQRYRTLLTRPGIKKIRVVGFTDDIGSETYNKDLSERRSHEVARLLSAKFDIPPALIEAEGRGISRDYPTKELNRRVEIYIFH